MPEFMGMRWLTKCAGMRTDGRMLIAMSKGCKRNFLYISPVTLLSHAYVGREISAEQIVSTEAAFDFSLGPLLRGFCRRLV
jgi:hypothetical protein